jgi:hypothetical protein
LEDEVSTTRQWIEITDEDPDNTGGETVILDDGRMAPVVGELHTGLTLADWDAINAVARAYWQTKYVRTTQGGIAETA